MASALAPGQAVGRVFEEADATDLLALQPLAEAVGGSYALLFRTGAQGARVEEAHCHGVDTGYVDRLKEAAREKFLPGWLSGLAPGSVFDRAMFGSDQQFARTTFFNHVIRPEGRFHCMIATPCVTSRHRFHLVIGRPRNRLEFCAESRRLLHLMLPQVSGILRLRADLADAAAAARRIEGALDCWPAPFLVMAADAMPRFSNEAARRWLARGDLIRLDASGRFALASQTDTVRLRRALAWVARADGEQVLVPDPIPGAAPMRLVLTPIGGAGDEPSAGGPDVLVRVEVPDLSEAYDSRMIALAREYDLTRRETALLGHLVSGDTLKGAARHLGISYNTGRTYLRQIFDKTSIHRQSDLLRFCVTGCRPRHRSS